MLNPLRTLLTALALTLLASPSVLNAIEIRQFDKMAGDDQIQFVDQLAQSVQNASHSELAARVKYFFEPNTPARTSRAWAASN